MTDTPPSRTLRRFVIEVRKRSIPWTLALLLMSTSLATGEVVVGTAGNNQDLGGGGKKGGPENAVVQTKAGRLRGEENDGIFAFRGIPYAAPPTGARRWLPPVASERWNDIREAREFGRVCHPDRSMLPSSGPFIGGVAQEESDENCLFLNVWTPNLSGSRPVMFFLHGGGFAVGSGSQPINRGDHLSRKDVVVVTINYRLGVFGFLPIADATGGEIAATGAEGLLDQVAALEWVRDNIAAFGGDPGNVTVFGVSAGGQSIGALLSMPKTEGLIHKAILQSSVGHSLRFREEIDEGFTKPFLAAMGTTDAQALRAASAEEIMQAYPRRGANLASGKRVASPSPLVGSEWLPELPQDALGKGRRAGIPILAGTTREEMPTGASYPGLTGEQLVDFVQADLPESVSAERLIQSYREARAARAAAIDPASLLTVITAHKRLMVPTTRILDIQRSHGPVFHYIFDWASPIGDHAFGAIHGVDTGFVFGTHATWPAFYGRGPAADALADAVMNAWVAFARSGNPSAAGLGEWPPYDGERRPTMMIGQNVRVVDDPFAVERRAWDDVPLSAMR